MDAWAIALVQLVLLVGLAPAVRGSVAKLKARMQGRRGASVLQPYYDFFKLARKRMVVPDSASWVFGLAPLIVFSSVAVAAMLLPVFFAGTAGRGMGDLFALVGLFALGRFFLALAALDAGTAFGGMGSSRDMTVAALAEPGLLLALFTPALLAGSTDLGQIVTAGARQAFILTPSHVLAFAAFAIVAVAETGRLPVDNPATHLELTMIHEAMILEYSGRSLALLELAAALRLTVLMTLLANVFVPFGIATELAPAALGFGLLAFAVKLGVLIASLAILETVLAKLRFYRVPDLLGMAGVLAGLALLFTIVLR